MAPIVLFVLSIILQLTAAVLALFLIRITGRKLAWILLSLAMVLMTTRRIVSFSSLVIAGKEITFAIPEIIAFMISCLTLAGVLLIRGYFRSIYSAKEALRESEQRFRVTTNTAVDAIISIDADSRIVFCNDATERLFGYSSKEVMDQNISLLMPEHYFLTNELSLARLFTAEKTLHIGRTIEVSALTKNGTKFPVEISLATWNSREGAFATAIIRDITERRKLETQLRQSQKMEAIGHITGGIAHDFNNMLNVILGYSQLIMETVQKNNLQYRHTQQIQKAGQSAADLVQQLLAFTKQKSIEPRLVNINDVVAGTEKMLQRIIGEDIEIALSLASDISPVMADPVQIEQVIMNICINARDAMPEGGKLIIETSNTAIDEIYSQTHPWVKPGQYVMLSISDTGIGMDEATQARIFEPFFTTKELGRGTGLGLAVVYGIVKQHNGFIHVYSERGYGTIFKIYIPPSYGKPKEFTKIMKAEIRGGKEAILLVEDNDMLRELAETMLKNLGYTVLAAKNGSEAVQIFTEKNNFIRLAILDVVMPVCGGRETFERMRAIKPDLKALFVTGYSTATPYTEFIPKEGLQLLQKPFSYENLALKVREILDSIS